MRWFARFKHLTSNLLLLYGKSCDFKWLVKNQNENQNNQNKKNIRNRERKVPNRSLQLITSN